MKNKNLKKKFQQHEYSFENSTAYYSKIHQLMTNFGLTGGRAVPLTPLHCFTAIAVQSLDICVYLQIIKLL